MTNPQRKIAAIGCWVAALAIVVAHASESQSFRYPGNGHWLAWLGTFSFGNYRAYRADGGLWMILLAALGAMAWNARGSRPPSK